MTSVYYIWKVAENPIEQYAKPDYLSQLFDFEGAILDSILPYKYFHRFIQKEYKEHFVYLRITTTYKRMMAVERILNEDITSDSIKLKIGLERDIYQ